MTRGYYPTRIEFEYDVEYSLDSGGSWTALAANTPVDIDQSSLGADGKIMIRSTSEDATSISWEKLNFRESLFNSVNIRNGKKLTTLANTFRFMNLEKLRINYVPAVTTFANAVREGTYKQVDISEMPSCTNIFAAFHKSKINELSDIKVSDTSAINMESAFNEAKINSCGEIFFPTNNGTARYNNNLRSMFYNSNIELFPYFEAYDVGDESSNRKHGFISETKTKYILSNKIVSEPLSTNDRAQSNIITFGYGYSQSSSSYSSFANNRELKFSGANLILNTGYYGASYNTGDDDCSRYKMAFYNNPKATALWSRFVIKKYGSYNFICNGNFQYCNALDPKKYESLSEDRWHIIEDPNWMPKVVELDVYDGHDDIKTGMISTVHNRIVKVENGKKWTAKWADRHDKNLEFGEPETHSYASDTVWFARNGMYAVQDGADIKFYDENDFELGTITGLTPVRGQLNADGSVFYVITGDRIDRSNTADQYVTNIVAGYDTSDGSEIFSFDDYACDLNSELNGIYCPDRESGINVLQTTYIDDNGGSLVHSSSKLISLDETGKVLATEDLSEYAVNVYPSFAESAEFVCVNNTGANNRVIRCFGS
jgi:hypothetical protein